jgi:hypothetical protein
MNKINQFLKNKTLHPYLIPFYFIVKGIIDLKADPNTWFDPLSILLVLCLIVFVLQKTTQLFSKNSVKNSIILSLLTFSCLFALPIFKTLNYWSPVIIDRIRLSFYICLGLTGVLGIVLFRSKKTFSELNYYLNLLFILFLFVDISIYVTNKWTFNELDTNTLLEQRDLKNRDNYNIYLFVPDGYSSNKSLKINGQFDNSDFTNYLKAKGFFIAKNAHTNYRLSVQTISSCLNLNYIAPQSSEIYLVNSIENNKIVKTLSKLGYDCFSYSYDGSSKEGNSGAPNLKFKEYYFELSIFSFLERILRTGKNVAENEDALPENPINPLDKTTALITNRKEKKQFIYAHSMMTHLPFMEEKDTIDAHSSKLMGDILGKIYVESWLSMPTKPRTFGQEADGFVRQQYGAAITKTNTQLKQILDNQWAKIAENSVIIIMGDHGFRYFPGTPEAITEDMYSNFCAIYFPDRDYSALNDSISPVNTLRMSLNKAIGTKLNSLPDKSEYFALYH